MAVRIGKIDLLGLQNLRTEDARNLIRQRGPGYPGSVLQDLGRESIVLCMDGLLLAEDSLAALGELRKAQQEGTPLSISADILAGADLTEVVIEELGVRQLAGYSGRFWFSLRVREYREPPEPPAAGLSALDADIGAAADVWAQGGAAAAAVLSGDPNALAGALADAPGLLEHLGGGQLGGLLDEMKAGPLGDAVKMISEADPQLLKEGLEAIKDPSKLGSFVNKLADQGLDLVQKMTGLDLGAAKALADAVRGVGSFLTRLRGMVDKAGKIGEVLVK